MTHEPEHIGPGQQEGAGFENSERSPVIWDPVENTTSEAVMFLRKLGSGPELEPILKRLPGFRAKDIRVVLSSIEYNYVRFTAEETRATHGRVKKTSIEAAAQLSEYFIDHPAEIPNPEMRALVLNSG